MTSAPREFPQLRFAAPPKSTEVLLLRHGASEPHRVGEEFPLVDGHGDPALAPEGVEQAELAARRLLTSGEQIDAVYVTTLRRTQQTAAPLVAGLGVEPRVIADLREVYLGEWEGGHVRAKLAANDPIAVRVYAERRWEIIPGAESHSDFTSRVRRGIETIATAHRDGLVVAVVHGGVIGAAVEIATGGSGFAFGGADNGSLTHLVVTADRWILRCFNDSSHLHATFRTVGLADDVDRGVGTP